MRKWRWMRRIRQECLRRRKGNKLANTFLHTHPKLTCFSFFILFVFHFFFSFFFSFLFHVISRYSCMYFYMLFCSPRKRHFLQPAWAALQKSLFNFWKLEPALQCATLRFVLRCSCDGQLYFQKIIIKNKTTSITTNRPLAARPSRATQFCMQLRKVGVTLSFKSS